jgi:hypothetical protein
MRGEEAGQSALLDALAFDTLRPARALDRYQRCEPGLPRRQQRDAVGLRQVECTPVVPRQVQPGYLRRAQRHRECLQRQRQAQRLIVGQGATGSEVTEGAGILRRIMRVAQHAGQLQAGLDFHVDGDWCGILADVVGVVGQGQHLRGQPGQQQVRGHVSDIARAVERYRFLQRGGQLMQFATHARFEGKIVRMVCRTGGDRRWIFRVEIASPVHMVAKELDQHLLQQGIVLAIGAEKARIQRVVAQFHVAKRLGGAHVRHPQDASSRQRAPTTLEWRKAAI